MNHLEALVSGTPTCWPGLVLAMSLCIPVQAMPPTPRPPRDDADLRYWLQNMVWRHRFTTAEIVNATGLDAPAVEAALKRFNVRPDNEPPRARNAPLLVVPYPGGRHPRIGFLDGAIDPQRETKVSVFTPWDPQAYVVADVPEAIWSNLGLTYLAHTHIPTVWTKQGIALEPLEWSRQADGKLEIERKLPNGIRFGVLVRPEKHAVRFEMWLANGTAEKLTGLRVQNCVMLKGAPEFAATTNANKMFAAPYAACRSPDGKRWVITAWAPVQRAWANPPCPCLHSDPHFPDCSPGETQRIVGWLSFFEGEDLLTELKRIHATNWHEGLAAAPREIFPAR